jgi:hypothetical protein
MKNRHVVILTDDELYVLKQSLLLCKDDSIFEKIIAKSFGEPLSSRIMQDMINAEESLNRAGKCDKRKCGKCFARFVCMTQ